MVTRVLELIARPGEAEALVDAIENVIRPLLRDEDGFMELVTLVSEGEASLIVLMTVWRSEFAGVRYEKEVCPQILALLEPHVDFLLPEHEFQFAHDGGCSMSAIPEEDHSAD